MYVALQPYSLTALLYSLRKLDFQGTELTRDGDGMRDEASQGRFL